MAVRLPQVRESRHDNTTGGIPASQHLVLAAIEDGVRALSIRVLGAYAESLGVRTTLLMIVRPPLRPAIRSYSRRARSGRSRVFCNAKG